MSGVVLTTISPSSTSSRRNTPWVDGCCGPIEIVIWVSSGRSTISNCGGKFSVVTLIGSSPTVREGSLFKLSDLQSTSDLERYQAVGFTQRRKAFMAEQSCM